MKYIILFLILLFVLFIVFYYFRQTKPSSPFIKIGNKIITVDVVKTPKELSLGLSYRKSLGKDHGMIFIFSQQSYQTFWMKGMNFNLDFIWIDGNKVVDITENVSAPKENVPDEALPTFRSKVPVTSMLEVNSGFIKEHNIHIGDSAIFHL
jgi:uncharacterized protein